MARHLGSAQSLQPARDADVERCHWLPLVAMNINTGDVLDAKWLIFRQWCTVWIFKRWLNFWTNNREGVAVVCTRNNISWLKSDRIL